MRRYGIIVPIVIDGGNVIVDGLARWEIALKLGYTHVPTVSVANWSPADVKALRLALNRLAEEAVWDRAALHREFQALIDANFDLDLTGFDTVEIESALEIGASAPGDVEELDASSIADGLPVISRPGDVWELAGNAGKHHIACGDFRDDDLRHRLFHGEQAQVCFTDPPYNVRIAGHVSGLGQKTHSEFAMASGEMSAAEFQSFLARFCTTASDHVVEGAILFVCIDWRGVARLYAAAELSALELLNLAVWSKTNPGMGSLYRSQHEFVVVFKKPGAAHRNNVELGRHGRSRSNVWTYRGVNVFGPERKWLTDHPTVKPTALVADALRDASRPGDIVFDPFLGSGTTLVAAERTKRRCFGIEIEPRFVDLAIRRWQLETGRDAVRATDGANFRELLRLPAPHTLLIPAPAAGGMR